MRRLTPILLALVVVALSIVAWQQGGSALLIEAFERGGRTLLRVLPLVLAAFAVAGLVQVVLSEEAIAQWMGDESGWRGLFLGSVAGGLMPGGPYAYYPVAAALLRSGASIGTLVAFVTAKNLWSVTRLPLEFALLGPYLTVVRFVVTAVFPLVMGVLAQVLFGGQAVRIREALTEQ